MCQLKIIDLHTVHILEPGKVWLNELVLKSSAGFVERITCGSLAKRHTDRHQQRL
jgi:hypothetical protein